jgi:ubiquinone/menaquinone biosynthesis C-methylase UbiE
MVHNPPPVAWSNGENYEPYVGRWSRVVATEFVRWLDVPAGSRWIDVGCGTGALTSSILTAAEPSTVLGVDPSDDYLEFARSSITSPVITFERGFAENLPAADDACDAAVSGLVLNFTTDSERALLEARRVTRAGGTVAAYVWDYSGEMWLLRYFWDTAIALDPVARRLHEGRRFASWEPHELERRFRDAGLVSIELRPIVIETHFRDFDEYWRPLLGGQGFAPSYVASLEATAVESLRAALQKRIPVEADGSLRLTARSWAVRAVVPG